jgi:hypothetical protein
MIYKYPEEFIIPVVYADDLKEKSSYRHEESEELRDWKLIIFNDELLGNKMFQGDMNISSDENTDKILSDIDNDYANSETLHIHCEH